MELPPMSTKLFCLVPSAHEISEGDTYPAVDPARTDLDRRPRIATGLVWLFRVAGGASSVYRLPAISAFLLLATCAHPPNINVRQTWGSDLGRLGVVAVYPPVENRFPGDVIINVPNPCEGSEDSSYIQTFLVDNISSAQQAYLDFYGFRPQLPETSSGPSSSQPKQGTTTGGQGSPATNTNTTTARQRPSTTNTTTTTAGQHPATTNTATTAGRHPATTNTTSAAGQHLSTTNTSVPSTDTN